MTDAWDPEVPSELMRIAQRIIEEPVDGPYDGPVDALYEVLGKPVPNEDVLYFARSELERLGLRDPRRTYEVVERLIGGSSVYDERVTQALASENIAIEMVEGRFWRRDEVEEELDVVDAGSDATRRLTGRWAPAKGQWDQAQEALVARRWPAAVANAANALESVVKVSSGRRSIKDGTQRLFDGRRASLGAAINQLHNYASAMPQARHGASEASDLTEDEARAVVDACGVFMAMIIKLDEGH